MKHLFNYDLKNYDPSWPVSERPSARGIILFENNKIALAYSEKLNYYKFPGGGINEGEDKVEAMIREVQEETGLVVIPSTVKEFGYASRYQKSGFFENTIFKQDNFYYTCQAESEISNQNLDDYEAEEGFCLKIVDIEEAVRVNKAFNNENPYSLMMIGRDTAVLEMLLNRVPEPSVPFAEYLLETAVSKNPGPWREHSYAVAKAAKKIAEAINKNGGKMNPDLAYVYGLLHDIGRQEGVTYIAHVIDGYEYFEEIGYKNVAKICLTHSFNLHIVEDYIGKIDVSEERYNKIKKLLEATEYTDYDRLIQVLDGTCGADGTLDLEKRMNDVKARYNSYPQGKWDKNFELKAYFEKLMGQDYYFVIRD